MLIELRGVEVRYGAIPALAGVDLALGAGRVGLLGPNGAGKSTLLKCLLGLVRPTAGAVRVLGRDVARDPFGVRARVGYMPEAGGVLPDLSALDLAVLAAELCGLPPAEARGRAHQVLHYVGLGEARYRKLGSFSTGMKQRARLAQALVADPELLLLDEPTSGLDPRGRDEMLALIVDIPARTGTSVVVSTHILPDVERTCDQVVVLASGAVRWSGALDALVEPDRDAYELRTRDPADPLQAPLEALGCRVEIDGARMVVRAPRAVAPRDLLRAAVDAGAQVRHLAPLRHTLEEAFLGAVGDTAPGEGTATPAER